MTRLGQPRGSVARRHTRPGGHARLDPALRPRSRTRRDRLRRRQGATELARARAARRAPRLPAPLGRGAPQHARHRELGACRPDRAPGERHQHDPRGLRRCDAAEPSASRRRRAVRDARSPPSRPDRPRHRPRARHGSDHRLRPATLDGTSGRRPADAARGAARLLQRHLPADHRRARCGPDAGDLATRVERLQRAPRGRAGVAVLVRPPLHAAEHDPGAGGLPAPLHPLADAARTAGDGRRRRRLRGDGRRGAVAARLSAPLVPEAPNRPPIHASLTRGGRGVRVLAGRAGLRRLLDSVPRGRIARDRPRRPDRPPGEHVGGRADPDDERVRPRCPAPLL